MTPSNPTRNGQPTTACPANRHPARLRSPDSWPIRYRPGRYLVLAAVAVLLAAVPAGAQQNLLPNGSFDDPSEPLAGWVTDYTFAGNKQYLDNKFRVSVVPMEDGRSRVARVQSSSDVGAKLETAPMPFEEGYRYAARLAFKGRDYRVYFAGYRWKPGVKPHDNPTLADLRQVYKSRAATGPAPSWTKVELELPGKELTAGAKAFLKQVKYVTLFIYVTRTSYVDDVMVTRRKDSSVRFP